MSDETMMASLPDEGGWVDVLKALSFAVGSAALVFLAVIGTLTLFHVDTVVGDVANAQSNHTSTLNSLHGIALQNNGIDRELKAELKSLGMSSGEIDTILQEAGLASHNVQQNTFLICAHLDIAGCVPPSS